jgi:hypothetical protein
MTYKFPKKFFRPKKQSKTNSTTSAILLLITQNYKCYGVRINTSGIPIIINNRVIGWRPSTSKGHPDIDGCYKGLSFKVEIKTGDDKLSEDQILFISNYEKAGGKCFVVRDSADFENQFKKHFKINEL